MAYCTNCGGEIADGAKFCTNCGAPQGQPHMQYGQPDPAAEEPTLNPFTQSDPGDAYSGNSTGYGSTGAGQDFLGGSSAGSYGSSSAGTFAGAGAADYAGQSSYGTPDTSNPVPGLTFTEAVQTCFRKYATFSGRARRSEYWYFTLFTIVVNFVLMIVGNMIFGAPADGGNNILQSIFSLVILVPGLAVMWRRLHDIGKSGAWFFIALVPIIGWILLLIYECRDSEPGENQYGMSPKYPIR